MSVKRPTWATRGNYIQGRQVETADHTLSPAWVVTAVSGPIAGRCNRVIIPQPVPGQGLGLLGQGSGQGTVQVPVGTLHLGVTVCRLNEQAEPRDLVGRINVEAHAAQQTKRQDGFSGP